MPPLNTPYMMSYAYAERHCPPFFAVAITLSRHMPPFRHATLTYATIIARPLPPPMPLLS